MGIAYIPAGNVGQASSRRFKSTYLEIQHQELNSERKNLHGYYKLNVKCVISFILMKTLLLMWKTSTELQGMRDPNYKSLIHYLVFSDKFVSGIVPVKSELRQR